MKDPLLQVKNDAFYKTLVGSLRIGLYSCDTEGNIVFFNETAVELWGQRPRSDSRFWAFHKAWFSDGTVVVPDESPIAMAIRNARHYHSVEMWVERPDASRYYAGLHVDLIQDEDGNVRGAVATIRDITDDSAAAKTFVESEVRHRQLIQSLPVATYLCDTTGRITIYNDAALNLWGRSPESADRWCGSWKAFLEDGRPISEIEHPMSVALREGRAIDPQVLVVERPDGTHSWIMAYPRPVFDRSGKVEGVVNMLIDITEERKSQQILEENMERLRLAVDSAELGTWDFDLITTNIVVSERLRQIFRIDEKTRWTREAFLARVHPDDLEWVSKEFDKAKESGKCFYEVRIMYPGNKMRWIRVNAIMVYQGGVPVRMLGTVLDVTPLREANEDLEKTVAKRTRELRRLNRQLEKSNHELEQFAYIASHDLQEPLRKIQTFATLVENVDNEQTRRKYLLKVREEAQGMSALVRDVLMFSRLSAIPEFDYVDLNQVLQDVTSELSLMIAERSAILDVGQLPAVMGISRQLAQLIANVISNSLKFCVVPPVINVKARVPSEEDMRFHSRLRNDRKYVHLGIQDNGIGFDQKYADQIFKIFQRLNPREAYPGNGIGLALCKKIVENHHGVITAQSEPGLGTTISIILPAADRDLDYP